MNLENISSIKENGSYNISDLMSDIYFGHSNHLLY